MEICIDRKAFESALGIGGMFAGKNRVQAVLGLVKITVRNDRIRMTSFTGEVGISTSAPINAETESDAVFCMEPALLLSAIKLIESDTVMLSADDDMKSLRIEYGGGEMTMGIYPATDFPEFGMDGEYKELHLDGSMLSDWAKLSEKFAADDQLRPNMSGMYMYSSDNEVGFCATDSHILVHEAVSAEGLTEFSAIMPRAALPAVQKSFSSCGKVRIRISDKCAVFYGDGVSLYAKLVPGKFPNFRMVIPQKSEYRTDLDKSGIISALKRVRSCTDIQGLVMLSCLSGRLSIEASDKDSKSSAVERCDIDGGFIGKTGCSYRLLMAALEAMTGETVTVYMNDPKKPLLIVCEDNPSRKVVLMPMAV